nr:MAG TPA: hypothetical protein [Caudoviricetes sp.]
MLFGFKKYPPRWSLTVIQRGYFCAQEQPDTTP